MSNTPMLETNDKPRITTITINRCDPDCLPWVSAFSSREKAISFKRKVEEKLEFYGKSDLFLVTMDSGELDDEQYLEWLDAEFGEEETRDEE